MLVGHDYGVAQGLSVVTRIMKLQTQDVDTKRRFRNPGIGRVWIGDRYDNVRLVRHDP